MKKNNYKCWKNWPHWHIYRLLFHTDSIGNYMTFIIQALTFPNHCIVSTSVLYCLYPWKSLSCWRQYWQASKMVKLRCYWYIVLLLCLKMFLSCPYAFFSPCSSDPPATSEWCFGFLLFSFSFLGEETSFPNSWAVQNWELDSENKNIKCTLENYNKKYLGFNHKSIPEKKWKKSVLTHYLFHAGTVLGTGDVRQDSFCLQIL